MKFIRRQALTPHTRINMVRLAWLNQGIYGKMTQIAQDYHISSTFLSQLIWAVVYLAAADKYRGLTRRPSQGQKGIDERTLMASQRPFHPW